jgi:hypothetical protein
VALDGLEARVALRLTKRLSVAADGLPHDISERLRFSREQALARARTASGVALAGGPVLAGRARGAAVMGGGPSVWLRLTSLLPLVVLAAGLVLIQQHREHEQIVVAAEIDAALLTDELPPAAYQDPGFAEYLRSNEMP